MVDNKLAFEQASPLGMSTCQSIKNIAVSSLITHPVAIRILVTAPTVFQKQRAFVSAKAL